MHLLFSPRNKETFACLTTLPLWVLVGQPCAVLITSNCFRGLLSGSGALKVHVVGESSGKEDAVPAHQLAWEFDLVLATFQQLSNQWSRHRRGEIDGAPLLQVRRRAVLRVGLL